ncbi:MAG: LytTR family transcriptional regulator DNA-binding domain-containing protein [Lactobacillus sp.]|nr:LytTR family DNA-binding domain-containing protein [Prevotella sp.]MBN2922349.1 LytTR family transcriptional regulator DNA-binding domain-containing protein [Lactobacillus sp.]
MAKGEYLVFNSRDELLRLDINRIVFFEGEGNYTNIVSANNLKGIVCMNLAKIQIILEEKLKEHSVIFARVGKRYIINLDYIYSINVFKQKLTLSDGYMFSYQLNIAKDALKKLKELHCK